MKILSLAVVTVIAGAFAYVRPHKTQPSDLRDAVADRALSDLQAGNSERTGLPEASQPQPVGGTGATKSIYGADDRLDYYKAPAAEKSTEAVFAPDAVIKAMVDKVMRNAGTATGDEIAALLQPNFNFEHMAMLAVGRPWAQADSEQRRALTGEFRTMLVRTYSKTLLRAGSLGGNIAVKPLAQQPVAGEAVVQTVAKLLGMSMDIDYRMEKMGDTWQVYDVKMDGVSLVLSYRGQFAPVVADSGLDGLIKTLADRNRRS
ncbi:MAG: ABC transporter substrate-binding protein [Elusimicrobiales bacterium]|nr:ABC transporter substrate-binding protein [Elusimicrobiales bacterium]